MIPDEAVEAAARVLYELQIGQAWGDKPEWVAVYEGYAAAALEAAAPHMIAAALREAADQLEYGNPINSWLYERADEIEASR